MALGSEPRLAVFVVWINMQQGDNQAEAYREAEQSTVPGISHFYDPEKKAGQALAEAMDAPGRVAWDIYMVYKPGVQWEERAPRPHAWVHQLMGALWPNPLRYRTGWLLRRELSKMVSEAMQPGSDKAVGGKT